MPRRGTCTTRVCSQNQALFTMTGLKGLPAKASFAWHGAVQNWAERSGWWQSATFAAPENGSPQAYGPRPPQAPETSWHTCPPASWKAQGSRTTRADGPGLEIVFASRATALPFTGSVGHTMRTGGRAGRRGGAKHGSNT